MREQPSAAELIDAVAEFITRDVAPTLTGRLAFHARVAANVLAIVKRELELGPAADRADTARLAALLGTEGEPGALTEELCRRIEAGEIAADDPALIEHLWATHAGHARGRPARLRHLPPDRGEPAGPVVTALA